MNKVQALEFHQTELESYSYIVLKRHNIPLYGYLSSRHNAVTYLFRMVFYLRIKTKIINVRFNHLINIIWVEKVK